MLSRGLIYSLQEGALTLWRNKLISLLSITTIAISFAVLGLFLLIAVNIGALAESYGDALIVHVFLEEGLDDQKVEQLGESLQQEERVASVRFVDRQEAEERFRQLFPEEAGLLGELEDSPLPASWEVSLDPAVAGRQAEMDALVSGFESIPGVERVLYDRQWVDTLEQTGHWFTWFGLVLGGLLIFAAIVTTSNIIKLNVLNRQQEIEIMRLVGADGIYVRGPFFVGGVLQGLLAAALAIAIIYGAFIVGRMFLESANIELLRGVTYRFLSLWQTGLLLLGGLTVGLLASLLSFGKAARL